MDDAIKEPVNDNRDIPEKLQSIPMSNKKIEAWKVQVAKKIHFRCIRRLHENWTIRISDTGYWLLNTGNWSFTGAALLSK